MVKSAIVASLLIASIAHADAPVDESLARDVATFERDQARAARLELRVMDTLLGGGIVSTIAGAGMMASDRWDEGLRIAGGLTAGFGVINVMLGAIAIPGNVRATHRFDAAHGARLTRAGLLDAQLLALKDAQRETTLFAINLGLDGGYLLAGLAAVVASQAGIDHSDRWLGGGIAACVQAAFLLAIDTTAMTVARRRHAAIVGSLAPSLNASAHGATAGVAGAF